jgi:GTPase SAR1 family protein
LIEDTVKEVLGKLNHKYTNELRFHFIPDENYSQVESSININSREVRIIGLWGMGGIGKTSLAAALFHKVSSQYKGRKCGGRISKAWTSLYIQQTSFYIIKGRHPY